MSAVAKKSNLVAELGQMFSGDVAQMEQSLLAEDQVPCPVIHRFGPGVYIREVKIPAGTLAIGHHQNFEHMNVMLQGRVTVLQDDGTTAELVAPAMFVGKPGRKIGYIHEDVVWLNIYATPKTDVDALEAKFITKSEGWGQHIDRRIKLLQNDVNQQDFRAMLAEVGVPEEVARAQAENANDMTDLPFGGYKIKVGRSRIEGKGVLATADIAAGEVIAPARINGLRTIAGRYTNHAAMPNAVMVRAPGGDIDLVATRAIKGCEGGQDGDEITIDYRAAYSLTLQIGVPECQQ